MNNGKRYLALLLCLVMLLSLFPASAFAADLPDATEIGEPVGDDALGIPDSASPAGGGAEQSEAEGAHAPGTPSDDNTVGDDALGVPNDDEPVGDDALGDPNDDNPVILSASEESQDDVLDVPNDDAALDDEDEILRSAQDDEDASAKPVRVVFVCDPAETVVTVCDPAHPDENGKPTVIDPEEDGSWLLVPGMYLYDAECEGYVSAEKVEFEVTAEKADVQILLPELNLYFEDAGLVSVVNETAVNALTSGSNGWTRLSITNATTAEISARLTEIKNQIDGRYWNNSRRSFATCKTDIESGNYVNSTTTTACQCSRDAHDGPHYNSASACQSNVFNDSGGWAEQCQGFANYMLYALFGVVRNLDGVNYLQLYGNSASDVSELKPGDVVNQNGGSHWYMVWYIDGNKLYVADCNRGTGTSANCKIQFSEYYYSASTVLSRIKAGTDRLNRPKCNDTAPASPTAITFNTVCAKSGSASGSAVTSVAVDKAIVYAAMTFGNDNKPDYFNLYLGTKQNQLNKLQISNNVFSDSLLATYYPNCTCWIDFNDTSDIASNPLVAGTTYYYQFEVVSRSGLSYRSEVKSFSTTGTAPTYTISYNANGGTGVPGAQTKTYAVDLTLSSTKPTRANASAGSYTVTLNANGGSVSPSSLTANRTTSYSFKNWNTAQNGSGTSYNSSASYTANAAATLYAQWNSNTTTAAVTLPTPTRSGYSFQGWATSSTATSGMTGSYTPTGNVTLYAIWEANTYTVSYNANGGTGAPANQTKIHDTALTLSSTKPTRANASAGSYTVTLNANGGSVSPSSLTANRTTSYSFKNWNTVQNGSGTSYASGASYTANAAATLYAQWNSSTTTAAVTLPTPTRSGYSFQGWATSSTATSGVTGSYTPTGNVTLYATWEANTYTVSYNANGGTGAPANQTKTHGTALTLSSTKPTRANASAGSYTVTLNANGGSVSPSSLTANRTTSYSFKNWNTAQNGSGTSYNSGASYTANAAATLYAQWNSNTTTAAVTLPTPTRSGYSFQGWATSNTATSGVTGSYTPAGNMTLYAIWEANTYTISYDANGGTGAPDAQTKTHDTALALSNATPTRADASAGSFTVTLNANEGSVNPNSLTAVRTTSYSFASWNTAQNGDGTGYAPGASYTENTAATLYAQWTETTATAAVELPTPTREGYSFLGWAETADATSGVTGDYTPSADLTLYAIWAQNDVPPSVQGTLSLSGTTAAPGAEIALSLTLDENPGVMLLNFKLSFDETKLSFLGGEDGTLSGWTFSTSGKGALWDGDSDQTATGTIVTLKFKVLDNVEDGATMITITELFAANHEEEEVYFGVDNASVMIQRRTPGDATGDGKVNGFDLIRMRKALAGENVVIDTSNADVTGDGKFNGFDLIRLRKYLAGEPVELK